MAVAIHQPSVCHQSSPSANDGMGTRDARSIHTCTSMYVHMYIQWKTRPRPTTITTTIAIRMDIHMYSIHRIVSTSLITTLWQLCHSHTNFLVVVCRTKTARTRTDNRQQQVTSLTKNHDHDQPVCTNVTCVP